MSTPAFPQTPSEPGAPSPGEPVAPTPTEPTAPTPAEPTIPLPPETAPAPSSGGDAGGAFAQDEDTSDVGSAEMDADNAVEQDVIDAVDPGGSPD
ncbi:hypothetical protein [Microbacterium proteolyticum]|jgi:2-oxoglutarate dehydrogenase E1 component|uniref:hypothetical protein n=1 Tax=Microbacterium proteolyticum TaxID=1572644 RepID=UPI001FABE75C|nr:hypothetical protein [Microbacterium proteolyticum]MCI9858662.1 hypothetical protein [Microbacterium proteolyticum]